MYRIGPMQAAEALIILALCTLPEALTEPAALLKLVQQSNNTVFEHWDRNRDGVTDLVAISEIAPADENNDLTTMILKRPTMWIIDEDFDTQPDYLYVDKGGAGKCEDIIRQDDLTGNFLRSFGDHGRP